MQFPETSKRIDIFENIKFKLTEPAWYKTRKCGSERAHALIRSGNFWYCCFSIEIKSTFDKIVVLRSKDGLEWEDTEFPFKNNDCQTEATMCADSAGNIHLCFLDNWQHTGYCVYSGGSWGRIALLPRFPERKAFDRNDLLLINSKDELILMATRRNEGKLYSRMKSGDTWGDAEILKLNEKDLKEAIIDSNDTIHLLMHDYNDSQYYYMTRTSDQVWHDPEIIPLEEKARFCMALNSKGIPFFGAITQTEILLLSKDVKWDIRKICNIEQRKGEAYFPVMRMIDDRDAHLFWSQYTVPVYRSTQVFHVSTADGENAVPANITNDDSEDAGWEVPQICSHGTDIGIIIPLTKKEHLFWFCRNEAETKSFDYTAQWRKILSASDKSKALYEYFLPMIASENGRLLLAKALTKVTEVSFSCGCLNIHFGEKFHLRCAAPAWMNPKSNIPDSCSSLASHSNRIIFSCPDNFYIVFSGLRSDGDLDSYGAIRQSKGFCNQLKKAGHKPEDIRNAAIFGKNILIFNPLITNNAGEPSVCRLFQETHGISSPIAPDLGFAEIFYSLIFDIINGENHLIKITETVVQISYTIRDSKGKIFRQITPENAYTVIPGHDQLFPGQQLFPGFQSLVEGKQIGDNFSLSLPCEKAFGKYEPALEKEEPRSSFPTQNVDVGQKFAIQEKEVLQIYRVIAVGNEYITLNGNHELAGQDISIEIGIINIRPATIEELEKGQYYQSENIYPDEKTTAMDYLSEWKRIADSPDLHNALREHFAFLAESDESKELLREICNKATQAGINGKSLDIEFEGGFTLQCAPPFNAVFDECIPKSCRSVAIHHNTISLEGHDVPLIFAGPSSSGELADSEFADTTYSPELEESVKLAIYAHQDEIVYSPFDKTAKGEPALSYISHESCAITDKYDGSVGEIFLLLMAADILDREIPIPLLAEPEIVIAGKTIDIDETELDLSKSGLSTLPPEIALLKELEKLNLSENDLESLPEEIGELTNLKELHLSNNKLKELPASFTKLVNLEVLDITGNTIESFPAGIEKMVNLQYLLVDLPPKGISKFKNIRELNANQITAEASELVSLKKIFLSGENINPFPADMPVIPNVESIHLYEMNFHEFPMYVCSLTSIKYLYVVFNDNLLGLPPEIGNLKKMRRVCFNGCSNLADIPIEIKEMQDMIIWESTHVALTPASISNICGLSNLTTLNLRHVPFTCIPEELGNLKNLKDLDLTETGLRNLYPDGELKKKIKAMLPKCKIT